MFRAGSRLPRFIPAGSTPPVKALGASGLAIAVAVGVAAALSWSVWVWTAFSGTSSEAAEHRSPVASESGTVTHR